MSSSEVMIDTYVCLDDKHFNFLGNFKVEIRDINTALKDMPDGLYSYYFYDVAKTEITHEDRIIQLESKPFNISDAHWVVFKKNMEIE